MDQGKFYRDINVWQAAERQARAAGPIPAINGHMGRDIRYQSVVNQQEHVLQSAASRQIIGWYTIVRGNDAHCTLGLWSVQPHWRIFRFDNADVNEYRINILGRMNAKFPGGLSAGRRALMIESLTGPNPGVGF